MKNEMPSSLDIGQRLFATIIEVGMKALVVIQADAQSDAAARAFGALRTAAAALEEAAAP